MPSRCAVWNQGHWQIGRMGGVVHDLDIHHRGEAAQPLGTNAKGIDLFVELCTKLFDRCFRPPGQQLSHVHRGHERLLGQQHGLLRCAADADP